MKAVFDPLYSPIFSTSAGLAGLLSDETGSSGGFVRAGSPSLTTPTMTSPVITLGIVGVVGDAARFGFVYLLSFTALISINLAVINLVPFPALDGGRLLFLLIEKIKGSRISPKIANTANAIGFALLIILMLVITYHDIAKLL
jgi:regulator of sigma E protease